jgi:hypothetical protein
VIDFSGIAFPLLSGCFSRFNHIPYAVTFGIEDYIGHFIEVIVIGQILTKPPDDDYVFEVTYVFNSQNNEYV